MPARKRPIPARAHGVPIRLDASGKPRLFTKGNRKLPGGVEVLRRMTEDEVDTWLKSKTGNTKIKPAPIEGRVP